MLLSDETQRDAKVTENGFTLLSLLTVHPGRISLDLLLFRQLRILFSLTGSSSFAENFLGSLRCQRVLAEPAVSSALSAETFLESQVYLSGCYKSNSSKQKLRPWVEQRVVSRACVMGLCFIF